MRKAVTALLVVVALGVCVGCATGPEAAHFAGSPSVSDMPTSAPNNAATACERNGGWLDQAAGVCDYQLE